MAQRGTNKYLSVEHENWIANLFGGRRSKSSGAAEHDAGDVRTKHLLIECKATQGRIPTFVSQFEKVAKEAWEEGKTPVLALRFKDQDNPLADSHGWVDLVVTLATDFEDWVDEENL